nr:hypothetical protein [Tanacetum cinerariifolium]
MILIKLQGRISNRSSRMLYRMLKLPVMVDVARRSRLGAWLRACCLFIIPSRFRGVGMPIYARMTALLPHVKLKGISPLLFFSMLYAYLSQHERHANEVLITREGYSDPLALVANSPTLYNPSLPPQHSEILPIPGIRQQFKMAKSQFNKFKEDNLRVLMALETEELLQLQGEIMQLPKRPRKAAWFKEKLMLAEAQEASQILDEEKLTFLVDSGILEAPVSQQTIP